MHNIQKVYAPSTSYPRYSYTSSCAIRIFKRFNVLLKNTELNEHDIHLPPKYGNPAIFIIRQKSGGKYFDENDIQLERRRYTIDLLQVGSSIENIRLDKVNEYKETILVVITERPDEPIEWVTEFARNTVIVCPSEENVALLTKKLAFIQELNVPVVSKGVDGVAIAIDALLERIVFRQLYGLVDVLKAFKDVDKGPSIQEAVQDKMSGYVSGLLGRGSTTLRGMFTELKQSQPVDIPEDPSTDSEDDKEPTAVVTKVPQVLETIDGIDDRYSKKLHLFYMLLYKVSEDIARKLEQFVHGRCHTIPDKIRQLFPVTLGVGTISSHLQPQILSLVVLYIPRELVLDDDEKHPEVSMLLKQLCPNRKPLVEGLLKLTTKLELVQEIDRRILKVKEQYDSSFHRLIWEIKGMYNRSKVPKSERPLSDNESKSLSPKVVRRLFEKVNITIGTGYRCDQLHVYIRENSDTDTEQARTDIKDVLAEFHISDYRVMTSKETRHYKNVGARIQVARRGTLGGFAWMNGDDIDGAKLVEQKQLCALMSKHVVNGSSTLYWIPKEPQGTKVKIGDILQVTDTPSEDKPSPIHIDVAAAKICSEQTRNCDTKFRNSNREPSRCQLYDFRDLVYLQGLPVHFCGASTDLGIGAITAPEYFVRDRDGDQGEPFVKYVIVEDTEQIARFCTMGDSGAIICADRPDGEYVDVISMIIGSMNYDEVDRDPSVLGKYLSFRMMDGLDKLQKETGHSFTLCSD